MRHRRLHNRIAESELTFPICALLAILSWGWQAWRMAAGYEALAWLGGGLLMALLVAYVVMETNNTFQLIRVRTRWVAGTWLLLASAFPFMHAAGAPLLLTAIMAICYNLTFHCYQLPKSAPQYFYITLLLSAGSILHPLMLAFLPAFFFYIIVLMRSMSLRTLVAGLAGILLPYLLWGAWQFLSDDLSPLFMHYQRISGWTLPHAEDYRQLSVRQIISWSIIGFYTLVGLLHYWRTNYNDKIRTRMMLYVFAWQTILLHGLLALLPRCYTTLMALMFVSVPPLFIHYLALSSNRFSVLIFFVSILSYLLLLYANLWMP